MHCPFCLTPSPIHQVRLFTMHLVHHIISARAHRKLDKRVMNCSSKFVVCSLISLLAPSEEGSKFSVLAPLLRYQQIFPPRMQEHKWSDCSKVQIQISSGKMSKLHKRFFSAFAPLCLAVSGQVASNLPNFWIQIRFANTI